MRVYLSYCRHDYGQAMYAARTLLEHTDFPHDKFYLYGSQHAPAAEPSLKAEGINLTRCSNDKDSYPVGANFMFAGLLYNMVQTGVEEPIFLMEADGFVTCKDWYERIKAAHEEAGTPVSGSMTTWVKPHHYNGNMVITPELAKKFPCLVRLTYDPWDCFHAELIAAHAANNTQIENPSKPGKNQPTRWWLETWERTGKPAYMHGCKSYQMWEWLEREAPSW